MKNRTINFDNLRERLMDDGKRIPSVKDLWLEFSSFHMSVVTSLPWIAAFVLEGVLSIFAIADIYSKRFLISVPVALLCLVFFVALTRNNHLYFHSKHFSLFRFLGIFKDYRLFLKIILTMLFEAGVFVLIAVISFLIHKAPHSSLILALVDVVQFLFWTLSLFFVVSGQRIISSYKQTLRFLFSQQLLVFVERSLFALTPVMGVMLFGEALLRHSPNIIRLIIETVIFAWIVMAMSFVFSRSFEMNHN